MTDSEQTEYVTMTAPDGSEVQVPANLRFGKEGGAKPIWFAIDDELYQAVGRIPANEYGELSALLATMPGAKGKKPGPDGEVEVSPEEAAAMLDSVMQMCELFLMDESAARLAERMKSKENPVDVKAIMEMVTELLTGVYASAAKSDDRPTKPTSD